MKLVEALRSVKDIDHPVVLHSHTGKGKGLPYAEKNREQWHGGGPFHVKDGSPLYPGGGGENVVYTCLTELMDSNPRAVVLNAATPGGIGFGPKEREPYVKRGQFLDVGIAEENAVGMTAGISRNGGTAVFATFAPFFQRVYDQMSHDVCLNSSPATFLISNPGIYGSDSNTHIAICDIQMFAHIPNMVYLAPVSREEFVQMFRYATTQRKHPTGIRFTGALPPAGVEDCTDYSVLRNHVERRGSDAAIVAVGVLFPKAVAVAEKVFAETGKRITVINPRFLQDVDRELLESLKKDHRLIITIEDGELMGGYGQNIAAYYGDSDMKVRCYGISKEFHTVHDAEQILADCGISVEKLAAEIEAFLNS